MRLFLIISLLIALVIDIGFAIQIEKYDIASHANDNNKEQHQNKSIEGPFIIGAKNAIIGFLDFADENNTAITALSTLVIAFFTIALAIATGILVKMARRQEETVRIHERAYGFGGPGPIRRQRPDGVLIRIEFGNHGRTPAFLRAVEWSVLPEKSIPKTPVYHHRLANRMTVSPQTRENTEASYICQFEWTERHALCVRFTYEDVFGETHRSGTIVRIRIAPRQLGFDAVVSHPPIDGYPEYVKWD